MSRTTITEAIARCSRALDAVSDYDRQCSRYFYVGLWLQMPADQREPRQLLADMRAQGIEATIDDIPALIERYHTLTDEANRQHCMGVRRRAIRELINLCRAILPRNNWFDAGMILRSYRDQPHDSQRADAAYRLLETLAKTHLSYP